MDLMKNKNINKKEEKSISIFMVSHTLTTCINAHFLMKEKVIFSLFPSDRTMGSRLLLASKFIKRAVGVLPSKGELCLSGG